MKTPLPKTALIIEDDIGLQATLVATLRSLGYEATGCGTAKEGLALAEQQKPTLIYCDVHLPEGDGRKLLTRFRESDALADCQFVLMTGDWVGASRQASIDIAADDYLAKPFSLQEFVASVNERYRQANL